MRLPFAKVLGTPLLHNGEESEALYAAFVELDLALSMGPKPLTLGEETLLVVAQSHALCTGFVPVISSRQDRNKDWSKIRECFFRLCLCFEA